MIYQKFTCIFLCSFFFVSCIKKEDNSILLPGTVKEANDNVNALIAMNVAANFNYETANNVTIDITILATDNTPIKNIPINILDKSEEIGGVILFRQLTDNNGKISGTVKLPAYINRVVIDPKYLGVIRNAVVLINNRTVTCTLGGIDGFTGYLVNDTTLTGKQAITAGNYFKIYSPPYRYLSSYDVMGKPNNLETSNATISANFLANLNATLPESKDIRILHSKYIADSIETNIHLTESNDIYFTFITEAASYKNSVAYFTYPTNHPPQTPSDIDSLHIILPNASLLGSGGALKAGNSIKLGRFNAGTSIGFALIANGWNGSMVQSNLWTVYSLRQLNPETAPNLKTHAVLLFDNIQSLFVVGFEDIRRDNINCDNDFNDCLFYIKSNQVQDISNVSVMPINKPKDTDGDGIDDVNDAFPTDPTRAYLTYYPTEKTLGTHAFEDNWPFFGDYDMNDLVVAYRYTIIANAQNNVVELQTKYVLKASGAAYRNGFGVEFPFPAALVKSATGSIVKDNQVVTLAANGCESGQTKAVIIPFDDAYTAMNTTSGFNTFFGQPFFMRDTIAINMIFSRPLLQAELGIAPFNPFIIINRTRGREAHIAGYTPTQKVDTRYFKTGVDNTTPSLGIYYKSTYNLPWGLSFYENFNYPIELKAINAAYPNFVSWAQSNGVSFTNWYKDSLNVVSKFIFTH